MQDEQISVRGGDKHGSQLYLGLPKMQAQITIANTNTPPNQQSGGNCPKDTSGKHSWSFVRKDERK